jgi:ERCC4-type nuclease
MLILTDTREQRPFTSSCFPDVEVVRGALPVGDYSLLGFEDRMSIERKELGDFIACLAAGRDRFERELARGRNYDLYPFFTCYIRENTTTLRVRGRHHVNARYVFTFHTERYVRVYLCDG